MGRKSACKQCVAMYYAGAKDGNGRPVRDEPIKLCARCGKVKGWSKYAPDVTREDGHQDVCSDCNSLYARYSECKPDAEEQIKGKVRLIGKYVKPQIVSIVREMAALQDAINAERAECDKRITEEQDRTESFLQKAIGRQILLDRLLRAIYAKRGSTDRDNMLRCDYGRVRYVDGHLRIQLYPEVAQRQRDKP